MNRSPVRFPLAEIGAVVGVVFGGWLIHNTFRPVADTPNYVLLAIGALDILLCFGLLGFLLRARLRDNQPLPRSWIAGGVVLIACFLGWIAALFLDSDRLLKEQELHGARLKQIAVLEDGLDHLSAALPAENLALDATAWKTHSAECAQAHRQLQDSLHGNLIWEQELARIDDEARFMARLMSRLLAAGAAPATMNDRTDFDHARERAVARTKSLRRDIAATEREVAATYRSRWQGVGAAALTGVVLLLGCLLFWLVFDRELRRSWKTQARLAADEARFRWLVENQTEPIAVLDPVGTIVYVNPAWRTVFNLDQADLVGSNLLERIHPDDRQRVQSTLFSSDAPYAVPCRLGADYGVWHDVEMHCQQHADNGSAVVRFRDIGESSDVPMQPQPELLIDTGDKARIAELESECAGLRSDLEHQRWLLGSHNQANSEGVLILSARGEPISWNPAFVRMWKLSNDTMSAYTWQTISAHMESQVESGWDDLARAAAPGSPHADSCWEMTLEGDRTIEVYASTAHDDPRKTGAVQFHFRDVTRHKDLETQLRGHHKQARDWQQQLSDHEEIKKALEATLREHEKRLKHLDKQLRERDAHCEEMESTLRDHQDRLHQMHERQESGAALLKSSKEAMRRLASGVANDINNVLSVVIGNTEVLRDNLPPDHVAQNYLSDILQATTRGTELSQRLLAYSRNNLLQMAPMEVHQQLAALEPKLRVALGHVQLDWRRADQALWVKTDARPFEQALLHLVAHAKERMAAGGTLTIRTSRVQLSRSDLTHADMAPGAYIRVQLEDTGHAIDADVLPRVFEPYRSVNDGRKGDLSLATAYGIVRQSGGCIEVSSEPGKGATWSILVPETSERPHEARLRTSA